MKYIFGILVLATMSTSSAFADHELVPPYGTGPAIGESFEIKNLEALHLFETLSVKDNVFETVPGCRDHRKEWQWSMGLISCVYAEGVTDTGKTVTPEGSAFCLISRGYKAPLRVPAPDVCR